MCVWGGGGGGGGGRVEINERETISEEWKGNGSANVSYLQDLTGCDGIL